MYDEIKMQNGKLKIKEIFRKRKMNNYISGKIFDVL